jgi:hypothetical protein
VGRSHCFALLGFLFQGDLAVFLLEFFNSWRHGQVSAVQRLLQDDDRFEISDFIQHRVVKSRA